VFSIAQDGYAVDDDPVDPGGETVRIFIGRGFGDGDGVENRNVGSMAGA
jgi:hypothetical protein